MNGERALLFDGVTICYEPASAPAGLSMGRSTTCRTARNNASPLRELSSAGRRFFFSMSPQPDSIRPEGWPWRGFLRGSRRPC